MLAKTLLSRLLVHLPGLLFIAFSYTILELVAAVHAILLLFSLNGMAKLLVISSFYRRDVHRDYAGIQSISSMIISK